MENKEINNLDNENIVVEIRDMINGIENFKDDFDSYCTFLKEMFLSGSGKN